MAAAWYPKHIQNTLRILSQNSHKIEFVLHVIDARIPISSFSSFLGHDKPTLYILSKSDLSNHNCTSKFVSIMNDLKKPCLAVNLNSSTLPIVKAIKAHVQTDLIRNHDLNVVVVGLPNVGKSTLINSLRCRTMGLKSCCDVANFPGVTRRIQTKIKILDTPRVYIVDTPGVLLSRASSLQLCATGSIKDSLKTMPETCAYILNILNRNSKTVQIYSKLLGCEKYESFDDLSQYVCKTKNMDPHAFMQDFLRYFRSGELGKFTLDVFDSNTVAGLFEQ